MFESIIFKDRKKLSPRYIPKEIVHREKQIDLLVRTFIDIKDDPDRFPLTVLQIIGPAGIGKTSTVIKSSIILENELKKNNITSGTILLVANEISLKPPFFFSYNNEFEVRFPGRYTLILVADRFDSPQGGKVDLTGARASNGTDGTNGVNGEDSPSLNTSGGFGHPGNPPHATAGDGNNIKIFFTDFYYWVDFNGLKI